MKVFPDKDIALLLADDDPVPRIYRFMEGADLLVPASAYTGNPDLFISVDVPVVERSIIPPRCCVVRLTWRALTITRHARSLPRSALGVSMPLLAP